MREAREEAYFEWKESMGDQVIFPYTVWKAACEWQAAQSAGEAEPSSAQAQAQGAEPGRMTNAQWHGAEFPGWQCFHCGEVFTTAGGARYHFGATPDAVPGCHIRVQVGEERGLLMRVRELEQQLTNHQLAKPAVPEGLIRFVKSCLHACREGMDMDGGDIQELADECGLIEPYEATEPCGSGCICAEVVDFPTTCYRDTDLIAAAPQPGGGVGTMKANHWIGLGLLCAALVMISTAKADPAQPEISLEDQCGYLAAWTYAAAIARDDGISKGMVLRFVGNVSRDTEQAIERAYEGELGDPEQVRLEAFRKCMKPPTD